MGQLALALTLRGLRDQLQSAKVEREYDKALNDFVTGVKRARGSASGWTIVKHPAAEMKKRTSCTRHERLDLGLGCEPHHSALGCPAVPLQCF